MSPMTPITETGGFVLTHTEERQSDGEVSRKQSLMQSSQSSSIVSSPLVEKMESFEPFSGQSHTPVQAAPIKQLAELELELAKLHQKPQQTPQLAQAKLYSEVVRQQSIQVTTNEPQNVSVTIIEDPQKAKVQEATIAGALAPNPTGAVRKISRFQVSTVSDQQSPKPEENRGQVYNPVQSSPAVPPNNQANAVINPTVVVVEHFSPAVDNSNYNQSANRGKFT